MGSFDYTPAKPATVSPRWRKPFAFAEGLKAGTQVATKNRSMASPARSSTFVNLLGPWDCAANSTTIVCVGRGAGNGAIAANITSPDGVTWTGRYTLASATWTHVVWDGTKFVASSGSNTTANSTDGITWTAGTAIPGGTGYGALVVFNGKTYGFAYGNSTASYGESNDSGATWTTKTAPTTTTLPTNLCVCVVGGVMYMLRALNLYSTVDGTNWTLLKTFDKIGGYPATPNFIIGNSKCLNVGFYNGPTIVTSVSKNGGATWSQFAALRFANLPTDSGQGSGTTSPTISGRADYNVGVGVGRVSAVAIQRVMTMSSGRMLAVGSLTEYISDGGGTIAAYHAFVMTSADGADWTAGLIGACGDGAPYVSVCDFNGQVFLPMVLQVSTPQAVAHTLNMDFEELIYDHV